MFIDQLENRRLFAGISVANGILQVVGSSGNDRIELKIVSKTNYGVNFVFNQGTANEVSGVRNIARSTITGVNISGRAGNDFITMGRVKLPSTLAGGSGADSLNGSDGTTDDVIDGGDGKDYLYGGPGDDSLTGGDFADTMIGAAGDDNFVINSFFGADDDLVAGGAGRDIVDGTNYPYPLIIEIGNTNPNNGVSDIIYPDIEEFIGGSQGDDISVIANIPVLIRGGGDNDTLVGNESNDTLYGDAGVDSLSGAGGADSFFTIDGLVDTLDGGNGTDIYNTTNTNPDFDALFGMP